MNKNTKGAIAIGAATVLLLGGGGTLALWNADTTVTAGSVTSGELNFDATAASGTWYHYDSDLEVDEYAISGTPVTTNTYLVVPEDELIFISEGVELTATGGEIYFTFDAEAGTADADGYETSEVEVTVMDGSLPGVAAGTFDPAPAVGADVYGGTAVNSTATLALSFVVTFDADDTDNQGAIIDFDAAKISVQQTIKQ